MLGAISLRCFVIPEGQSDLKLRMDNALLDVHKKYVELEEIERQAVRSAMIEERSRFCSFLSFLKPLMVRSTTTAAAVAAAVMTSMQM